MRLLINPKIQSNWIFRVNRHFFVVVWNNIICQHMVACFVDWEWFVCVFFRFKENRHSSTFWKSIWRVGNGGPHTIQQLFNDLCFECKSNTIVVVVVNKLELPFLDKKFWSLWMGECVKSIIETIDEKQRFDWIIGFCRKIDLKIYIP